MRPADATISRPRLPPLWLTGSMVAATTMVGFGVARWIDHFLSAPNAEDYRLHAAAARIGLTYGWSHIYDLAQQKAASIGLGPIDSMHVFISPPPSAWMVAPIAWLPISTGFLIWTLISLAAFAAAAWLVCPGPRLVRATLVLISLALWPVHYQFWLGQWTAATLAVLAVSWWLLDRQRLMWAGIVLALAFCLKPQDCLLVPLVLLISGRWRPVAAFAVTGCAIAALAAASLRPDGIASWLSDVGLVRADPFNAPVTYSLIFGRGPIATGVELALGMAALGLAWYRRDRLDLVFALGIAGTIASATYLHEDDVAMLVLPAWILLRARPSVPQRVWLLAGVAAAQLLSIGLAVPILLWEPVWIGLLALEPRLLKAGRSQVGGLSLDRSTGC